MNKMSVGDYRKELSKSDNEELFLRHLGTISKDLAKRVVREHKFHPTRRWKFDFCFMPEKLVIEIDGVIPHAFGGKHNSDEDREKLNIATVMGWRILRFSANQIKSDPFGCIELIQRGLKS